MSVVIRPADLASARDAQAVVALTDMYAREPIAIGRPLGVDVRKRLVGAMRKHGGVRVLLAWEGDRAVGILTAVLSFTTFSAAPVLNIHDLAVVPEARGHGVGQNLLDAAERLARDAGCSRLSLEVLPENPAKRLYERVGYSFMAEFWRKELGPAEP